MARSEDDKSVQQEARDAIDASKSRRALKRLGAMLDDPKNAALRNGVVKEGQKRGVVFPDELSAVPGKRLLRLARGREQSSRIRANPIAKDESFICNHCAADVPAHGRTARNHCPECLSSLHVDEVPGDRLSQCGGRMEAVGVALKNGEAILLHQCHRCGQTSRNRALLDGNNPDNWKLITKLSTRGHS